MYSLSSNVDVESTFEEFPSAYHSNNLSILNGKNNQVLPHTITFFQQSDLGQLHSSVEKFVKWHESHNHKTVVTQSEEYGTNVSFLKCLGAKSYELELGTYCPDALVFDNDSYNMIRLNSDTFRSIRQGNSEFGKYEKD